MHRLILFSKLTHFCVYTFFMLNTTISSPFTALQENIESGSYYILVFIEHMNYFLLILCRKFPASTDIMAMFM